MIYHIRPVRGRQRARVEFGDEVERALETVRFLRPEIVEFVGRHGAAAAQHLERVIAVWYGGTLQERVAFMRTCQDDPTTRAAWRIVHAAGARAAPLIPYAVRRSYYNPGVPRRHG
jgi:hypothetical protein